MHPLGSIGEASDVASLAAWLHSDQAKFATGQTFVIDGGISKIVPKAKA
jgi:meso-butanediol dehydrogenase/(S,S)-butanediol dehydrogenase/diacetyl reductase